MPVNPDIIFILLYFQKKVYRQSEARSKDRAFFFFPAPGAGIFYFCQHWSTTGRFTKPLPKSLFSLMEAAPRFSV